MSTSSIFVMILALPPRGIVSCFPQARHFTGVLAQPKIICVELHSVHDILRNRDFGVGKTSLSFMLYTSCEFEFLQPLGSSEVLPATLLAREQRQALLVDLGISMKYRLGLRSIAPEFPIVSPPAFCQRSLLAFLVNGRCMQRVLPTMGTIPGTFSRNLHLTAPMPIDCSMKSSLLIKIIERKAD